MTKHRKPPPRAAEIRPAATPIGRVLLAVGVLICVGIVVLMMVDPWGRDDAKPAADDAKPAADDAKPAAGDEKPAAGVEKPAAGEENGAATSPHTPEAELPEPPTPPAKPSTAAAGDDTATPPTPALAEEDQDRALRREQLEVTRTLATAFPGDSSAAFLLGMACFDQGDSIEAAKHFEQSARLDPRRASAHDYLGQIAFLAGQYEKALELFRKAAATDPQLDGIHYRIAEVLVQTGRPDDAIPELQKDLEATSDAANSHRLLGEAWFQLKQYEKARQSYEAAVRVQPGLPKAYYGLAMTCARLKLTEKSKEYHRRFQELTAERQQTVRHFLHVYDPLKTTRESTAHTHTNAGRVYHAHEFARRAEQLWRRAAEIDPNNVDCRIRLASLRQRQGRPSDAIELFSQVIEVDPNHGAAYALRGNVRLQQEQFDEAEKDFKQVIEVLPERSEGYRALARLYLQLDRNFDEAKALAAKAAELRPVAPHFVLSAIACEKTGDLPGAAAALRRATELAPGNAEYRQMYERIKRKEQDE